MDKFKNKYRIQSHRKPNWDYSSDALYFLTLVTQNRECNLGKIVNKEIILSDFGKIVEYEWFQSFEIRKELILHQFILMPNHLHTIVEIYNENRVETPVEAHGRVPLQNESELPSIKQNAPIRLPKSISSFIAGFKSAVNTKIDDYIDEHQLDIPKYNKNNHFFQPNYHDHIIRNDIEYQNISNYIINNPAKWVEDKFYV
ncbi:MAG: transposase [Cytophagales bacterium]|nr:MAG: transposase [Cytophagales bacterium]TAF60265.1 MAG: transposase [Cytophagales bacterium]